MSSPRDLKQPYLFTGEGGKPEYRGTWAFSRADERKAFEEFVDFIMVRWERFPGLHIYHYAPYEPAALTRHQDTADRSSHDFD